MATNMDAAEVGRLGLRLRLITDDQLKEALGEISPGAPPSDLTAVLERKGSISAYQGHKLLRGDTEGYFLGGYSLKYKFASGSFGRVWRAEDPRTGVPVAVKVLRRRWCDDPHKVDLFEREGKVGLTLSHRNIVQILAVHCDRAKGEHFIAMEFVEGANLRDLLVLRKTLDAREAIRITEECAGALAYAFTRGLTHRDMKPSNILMATHGGTAKLVDFGLAEIAKGMLGADDETAVDRTVDYAGLEKATGVKSGDVRSDIFFMGCVLYEMLCGRPALPVTRDRRARMLKARFESIVPLTKLDVAAPPSVFQLLDRMLAFDPTMRFQTPSQFHDAVRMVQAELGGGPAVDALTPEGPRTVYVVEKNLKFQNVFRDKFKAMGFRVLLSVDASRALQRYKEQAFHAMVFDLASAGDEALDVFKKVLDEAAKHTAPCAGILLLSDEQEESLRDLPEGDRIATLTFPLKKGVLENTLTKLLPAKT
jgi:serine/threonine protein kinase